MAKKLENFSMPDDPIFIIGHWRTGTTLLHQLMALDDNLVTPNVLQVSTPGSFLVSNKFYSPVMSKAMKPTRPMDNVKLDIYQPQEDEYALIKLTADSPLERLIFPAGNNYFLSDYNDYNPVDESKWKEALKSFCKRLSFIDSKRVLLKNPFHSLRIPLLLEMFPNAKFIHIHRDPLDVVPSTMHMWKVVGNENKLKNKQLNPGLKEVSIVYDKMLSKINTDLNRVDENAKVEVSFSELESDPLTTIKHIYNKLELNYSSGIEENIKTRISETKTYQKNIYQLSDSEKETIKNILGKHIIYYNYKQ